ncbi:MAG: glycosyltransferase family 4 protein, partial [Myxococcales bacterium]|nr:glycosyltransferase family 4 protein [Myxococcales bacterium]
MRMRIAHVLPGFDAIGETYIYNFVHYHKRSEPFVIVPPSASLDAVRLPGNKVTLCRDWSEFERVLEREQIDVVHAHTGLGGTLALIPLQSFRLPYIVSFYGIEMGAERHDRVRQEAYRVLFRTASRVLVPSAYHKGRLVEAGCLEPKLRVVNLGVNVEQFSRSDAVNRYDRMRVLSVGRLVQRKGLLDAIEAFREALIDAPGMELYIAGEGPMRREIERYISKLGLRDVVFLLGALPNNMIAELMQRADMFLLPCATTAEGDEDGAPITLLEAQACGIPVISTRHGGIPEMVCDGESGFLVAEHDIHGLSSAMVKLALDRKLRRSMGDTGRSLIEKAHDIEKKIVELEDLYAELIGRQVWYSPNDFYPVTVEPQPGLTRILVLHEGSVLTLYSRLLYLRDRSPG